MPAKVQVDVSFGRVRLHAVPSRLRVRQAPQRVGCPLRLPPVLHVEVRVRAPRVLLDRLVRDRDVLDAKSVKELNPPDQQL